MFAMKAAGPTAFDRLQSSLPKVGHGGTGPMDIDRGGFSTRFDARLDDAQNRINDESFETPSRSDVGSVDGVDRSGRSERTRRSERVDDTQATDNERTESTNEQVRSERRQQRESTNAGDEVSDDSAQSADATASEEHETDEEGDELTPEAIVAAVMTMASSSVDASEADVATAEGVETVEAAQAIVAVAATVAADNETSEASEGETQPNAAVASNLAKGAAKPEQTGVPIDASAESTEVVADVAAQAVQPAGEGSTDADAGEQEAGREQSRSSEGESSQAKSASAMAKLADPAAAVDDSKKSSSAVAEKVDSTLSKLASTVDPTATPNAQHANPTEATRPTAMPAVTKEQQFARDNLDNLVTSVRHEAAQAADGTKGGSQMRIRLDPPELGALEVAVKMVDGKMSASFTTSNDQATQLLSHTLNHLKATLEASGVQVDRIQVRQTSDGNASSNQQGSSSDGRSGDGRMSQFDGNAQQNSQQRKDAVERMWRRFAYGSDDLDLVA